MRHRRSGFSLVEILVVVAIMMIGAGILLTVASKIWKVIDGWRAAGDPRAVVALVAGPQARVV